MKDLKWLLQEITQPGTPQAALFCGVSGVVVAMLILIIGFFKTLLIVCCCAIGLFIGGVKDKKACIQKIVSFFHREDE